MATSNELLLDAVVRHQIQLLRFSKGEVSRAVKLLEQSDKELVALLEEGLQTAFSEARLKTMLKDIRRMRTQVTADLKKQMTKDAAELAESEATWEANAIAGTAPVALALAAPTVAVLKALAASPINGVPLDGWLSNMATSDVNRIEQAVRLGVLQGETKRQIMARVLASTEITKQAASTIVRTSVNNISNNAAQSVWDANADILDGVRWVATLDGRTSPICRSRDGEVYPLDKGPRPPAHPNCRSRMAPVVKGERIIGERPMVRDDRTRKEREVDFRAEAKAKAGDNWKNMSAADRTAAAAGVRKKWIADNVGTVPSNVTYDQWLRRQPKAFQDEVLGPGRGELFRKGMTLDKFVDEKGKQYTLAQLKAATAGDALNVIQPGIGLKAKSLLQQGFSTDQVLAQIKGEFPDAAPTMASMASYKSELKKAGLLNPNGSSPSFSPAGLIEVISSAIALEASLPPGLKHSIAGQWLTMAQSLEGSPGAYAHYKSGKGVVVSLDKMSSVSVSQAQQVLAHELGHLLHKQHQLQLPDDVIKALKAAAMSLDPDAKKLYSYYLAHLDELTAEIYAQALSPSPITSQGLLASKFNKVFGPAIEATKLQIAKKFPAPPTGTKALQPGAPVTPFEVAGKHTSIGSLAKALLQQGMPDGQVLLAVKAEFPDAKTGMASIASYKSQLNKEKKIALQSGPVVVAKTPIPSSLSPAPPTPALIAATEKADDAFNALMEKPPALFKISSSAVKEMGIKMMGAGVLQNNDILAALSKLYPLNKVTPASVATWKSVWKKGNPTAFLKAQSKHIKLDLIAAQAGPNKEPFLLNKVLGFKSNSILMQAKEKLAAGWGHVHVKAFIEDEFGGPGVAQAQGADNLLELAIYQVDTAKAMGKSYLNGASTYKVASQVQELGTSVKGKIIPPDFKLATEEQINDMVDAIVEFEDAGNPGGSFHQMAFQKKLIVDPVMMNKVLVDFEINEIAIGEDLQFIVQKQWDDLNAAGVNLTPSRFVATPYEGKPPPPRFTRAQHGIALKAYGAPAAPSHARQVNDRFGLKGDAAVTPEEIGAIRSYTGNKTYERVNRMLREGKYAYDGVLQAFVEAAQHGMLKMPAYVGPVTRGVRWLPNGMTMDQFLARYQVGDVVEEHSFLSTSKGGDAAYGGPVYFKINSKTGRDVDWISKFPGGEKEVLMMPGTRLKINKVEKNADGKWVIWADEVI